MPGRRPSPCVGWQLSCDPMCTQGPSALPPLRCHVSGDAQPQLRDGDGDVSPSSLQAICLLLRALSRLGHSLATPVPTWTALACYGAEVTGAVVHRGGRSCLLPWRCYLLACAAQVHVFSFPKVFCLIPSCDLQGNSFLLLGFVRCCFISNLLQKPQGLLRHSESLSRVRLGCVRCR